MGIFFGSSKPKISESEYTKHVRGALLSRGLSSRELGVIDMLFNAALHERSESERGIDETELSQAVRLLEVNHKRYGIHPEHIKKIDEEMKKWLRHS